MHGLKTGRWKRQYTDSFIRNRRSIGVPFENTVKQKKSGFSSQVSFRLIQTEQNSNPGDHC